MPLPQLHPTTVHDGVCAGVEYRVEGELVPTLHLKLDGSVGVMFEHHVILWKQESVMVGMMKLSGAFKRFIGNLNILMTRADGEGEIAFSRDTPGQIFPLNLYPGQEVLVRENQFLAVTTDSLYSFERVKGVGAMFFGSQGFFVDRFIGGANGSTLWLHTHGNAFDVELAEGESIDVEPGAWVYRDTSVRYEQQIFGLKTGILGSGGNLVFNRFTGPGHIGLQSGGYTNSSGGKRGARRGGIIAAFALLLEIFSSN